MSIEAPHPDEATMVPVDDGPSNEQSHAGPSRLHEEFTMQDEHGSEDDVLPSNMVEDSVEPQDGSIIGTSKSASKKAAKKAARLAKMQIDRKEKRHAEKERRKQNMARKLADMQAGKLSQEEVEALRKRGQNKKIKQKIMRKERNGQLNDEKGVWKGGLVVDLGFDELMHEGEIKSMVKQISYIYSSNRVAKLPFRLILNTSFGARLGQIMEQQNQYHRWHRIKFVREGLRALVPSSEMTSDEQTRSDPQEQPTAPASSLESADTTISFENPFKGQKLIYLSADSENELDTLSENETYIIGGIVDRNRYKNLCQRTATTLGIETARLPIGRYLADLPTRKVLTVNQVFEILLKYNETKSWEAAFHAVIPQRKFHVKGRKAAGEDDSGSKPAGDAQDQNDGESGSEYDEHASDDGSSNYAHRSSPPPIDEEEAMLNEML